MSDDTRPVTVTLPWSKWVELCGFLVKVPLESSLDELGARGGFVGLIHHERSVQYPEVPADHPRDVPRRKQMERARKRRGASE